VQPATVVANGVEFAYLSAGSGPLVLLLHGFPDTARTWDRAMPALAAAGYRAVAPFMRGYAPTQIPADGKYDVETLGRDAIALIDALGESSAVVVGHDWGASAAYAAAGLAPERVRLLVTLAIPHPRSLKPTLALAWKVRHFITLRGAAGPKRLRKNDFALVDELWHRWSPAWKNVPASETADVKRALAPPGAAEAACAYYSQLSPKLPPAARARVTVPAVAFAGEHDIIEPRAYERARTCFDKSYEVVIVPGGHFMHREHPETFTAEPVRAPPHPPPPGRGARTAVLAGPRGQLLLGADSNADPASLVPAYDDAAGVTAAFDANILTHLNRSHAATFDPGAFTHRAVWDAARSRIEMHLVSTRAQQVEVAGHPIAFAAGEPIVTEHCYKHPVPVLAGLLERAGWTVREVFTEAGGRMRLWLADVSAGPGRAS